MKEVTMSRRAFYVVPLLVLTVISLLLAAGGFALLRWVWSQGYIASQLAAGEELPPAFGHPLRPFGARGFFCMPTLLFIFGGLVLLGMIGRWAHMWTWHRAMRGPGSNAMWWGPGGRHWHHGPVPSWFWERPEERQAEEAESETAEATSPPEE
jgi:hypothetical protein